MDEVILEVQKLSKAFGGLRAVHYVDFQVQLGQIKAMIGPNGAGKTTIFNLITGVYPVSEGRVFYKGNEITGLRPHQVAALGLARTFQNVQLFGNMTVLENVMVGCHMRAKTGILGAGFRTLGCRQNERAILDRAMEVLATVGLEAVASQPSLSLPFGDQRMLEIGRALALEPEIMLLDEPGAGLNPMEKRRLADLILKVRASGITIFLVDHHMDLVMGISDEVMVINYGEKISEGSPKEVMNDERVIAAYLGEEEGR